jgi:hypothetical protein
MPRNRVYALILFQGAREPASQQGSVATSSFSGPQVFDLEQKGGSKAKKGLSERKIGI